MWLVFHNLLRITLPTSHQPGGLFPAWCRSGGLSQEREGHARNSSTDLSLEEDWRCECGCVSSKAAVPSSQVSLWPIPVSLKVTEYCAWGRNSASSSTGASICHALSKSHHKAPVTSADRLTLILKPKAVRWCSWIPSSLVFLACDLPG